MLRRCSILLLFGVMLCAGSAYAQVGGGDPCGVFPKSSAAISISSATTTSIIALTAGQAVYVCGVDVVTGASTTWQLEYGTGATCGTGLQAMSGVISGASTVITPTNNSTQMVTPVGQRVCILSTGSGGIHGYLNYVQM